MIFSGLRRLNGYKFSILDVVLNNKAFTYKNTIELKLQNFDRVFLPLFVLVGSPLWLWTPHVTKIGPAKQ